MTTFTIDSDDHIKTTSGTQKHQGTDQFTSLDELAQLAEPWPAARLVQGAKKSRPGVRVEALVHVRHYANDLLGLRTGSDENELADRVQTVRISRPEAARQALVNDGHRRGAQDISRGELLSPLQWNFLV